MEAPPVERRLAAILAADVEADRCQIRHQQSLGWAVRGKMANLHDRAGETNTEGGTAEPVALAQAGLGNIKAAIGAEGQSTGVIQAGRHRR